MSSKLPKVPPVGGSTAAPLPELPRTMADMLPSPSAEVAHFRNFGASAPPKRRVRRLWVRLYEDDARRLDRILLKKKELGGDRKFGLSNACAEGLSIWAAAEEARQRVLPDPSVGRAHSNRPEVGPGAERSKPAQPGLDRELAKDSLP